MDHGLDKVLATLAACIASRKVMDGKGKSPKSRRYCCLYLRMAMGCETIVSNGCASWQIEVKPIRRLTCE